MDTASRYPTHSCAQSSIASATSQPRGRVVFVMPRCRHDDVRGVHKQAYSLSQAGYEVILVVKNSEVSDYLGMKVVVAAAPFESILRPLLNFPALFHQVTGLRADIVVLRNPDTILLALALRIIGHYVIYDTHEDFSKRPLIYDALPMWQRPTLAWAISRLEKLLARIVNGVVVTQAHQLRQLGGKTMLQPNAPLIGGPIIAAAHAAKSDKEGDELSLVYVGTIAKNRGIFSMLEMVERMNQHHACRLELAGWFTSEKLQAQAMQHRGWRFTRFHGAVSHAESLAHIMRADIGMAVLESIADYPTSSITKLYEYMQFGVPFIASDFPAWKPSTKHGPAGLYINAESIDDLVAAGLRLASDRALRRQLGESGRRFIATEFNWELVSEPFLQLVDSLLASGDALEAKQ